MQMKTVLVLFCAYIAYVILGGGLFYYVESEEEIHRKPVKTLTLKEILEGQSKETTTQVTYLKSEAMTTETPGKEVYLTPEETLGHNMTWHSDHLACGHQGVSAVMKAFRGKVRRVDNILTDLYNDINNTDRCVDTSDIPLVILSYKELEAIVLRAAQAGKEGVRVEPLTEQQEHNTTKWDFQASVGFALTVVTTIGYGHISPASGWGKAICVLYALFGIPFTAVLVTNIAHHVGDQIRKAALRVHKDRPSWSSSLIKRLTAIVLLVFCVVFFVLSPALVIWHVEGWTFLETLYYVFISLSTIGFGDYVVGQQAEVTYWPGYVILIFTWILCGIEYLATIFELISRGISGLDTKIGGAKKADEDVNSEREVGDRENMVLETTV